jgi:hypothetical protein
VGVDILFARNTFVKFPLSRSAHCAACALRANVALCIVSIARRRLRQESRRGPRGIGAKSEAKEESSHEPELEHEGQDSASHDEDMAEEADRPGSEEEDEDDQMDDDVEPKCEQYTDDEQCENSSGQGSDGEDGSRMPRGSKKGQAKSASSRSVKAGTVAKKKEKCLICLAASSKDMFLFMS